MSMRLSRWMAVIGVMVMIGCLQVAQRNALLLKGYAVGERMHQVHTQESDVAWLSAEVTGLASPSHLASVAAERRLKLVAWLRFPPASSLVREMTPDEAQTADDSRIHERSIASVTAAEQGSAD